LKKRIKIPSQIQIRVLYKSAKACAVCRNNGDLHFHHIDQNPSNNSEDNIIVLCTHCHDEAHTKHSLSQNLDKEKLIGFKKSWETEVENRNKLAMTEFHGKSMINWVYFNFDQLPKYIQTFVNDYKDKYYYYLLNKQIITNMLDVTVDDTRCENIVYRNIFDVLDFRDSHALKQYFENMVNEIIKNVNPYDLNTIWTKREIKYLVKTNDFIFLMNGAFFKTIQVNNKIETRRIRIKAKKIIVEGYIYTNYMFGSSSYCDSFKEHKIVTGLYFIKSINQELGNLVLHVTPLALGSGNFEYESKTPYILRLKNG